MLKITSEFDDSGFRRLEKKLEEAENTENVSFADLFPAEFVTRNTKFSNMQEMLDASGVEEDEFGGAAWDGFVRTNSSFDGWQAMLSEAGGQWMKRKLGF